MSTHDSSVKYGSRILTIAGVEYVADRFVVTLESSVPVETSGMIELQYVKTRPHVGDMFATQVEGELTRFLIQRVEWMESQDYFHKVRCSFIRLIHPGELKPSA